MYHIIINPASRSGKGAKIWSEQIEPALKKSDAVFQTYFSKKAGEVKHLAAQITAEYKDDPDLYPLSSMFKRCPISSASGCLRSMSL